jgi:23S rRNA (pseudouridine1915-N3)-methyltransferase
LASALSLFMKISLVTISPRRSGPSGPAAEWRQLYIERTQRYLPCEHRVFATEAALLRSIQDATGRTRPILLLADSHGDQLSSEEFATLLGRIQDEGAQSLIFAIGPPDGWSKAALALASRSIAFGRITLPHELAAVVAAEQIYRALTIRAGHPYHSGH